MTDNVCAICGAVYLDAGRHQSWHDDLHSWTQAIEQGVADRMRERTRTRGEGHDGT